MYVRVKRLKTTIFLETEPQETGIELKSKLQKLLDGKVRVLTFEAPSLQLIHPRGRLQTQESWQRDECDAQMLLRTLQIVLE
jgi:hypothetical protein